LGCRGLFRFKKIGAKRGTVAEIAMFGQTLFVLCRHLSYFAGLRSRRCKKSIDNAVTDCRTDAETESLFYCLHHRRTLDRGYYDVRIYDVRIYDVRIYDSRIYDSRSNDARSHRGLFRAWHSYSL